MVHHPPPLETRMERARSADSRITKYVNAVSYYTLRESNVSIRDASGMPLFAGAVIIESMCVKDATTDVLVARSLRNDPPVYIVIETVRDTPPLEEHLPRHVKRCVIFDEVIEYRLVPQAASPTSEAWALATMSQTKRVRAAEARGDDWFVQHISEIHSAGGCARRRR